MKGAAALLSAVCWVALAGRPAWGQEALVLGGGGSRGLAHAGVVVGLERLGRDPELVVGTSMGAIIGALYAAGYAPERIWRIIETKDWPALFTPAPLVVGPDRTPRSPVLQFALDPGRADRVGGLIADWRINRMLVRLLFDAQARGRGDFDRLPRRFRAVATDLETGALVAPGSGDLARAVRASMAVPGVFPPVPWRDRLLVDGGVSNYLPIAVADSLGARQVVAVDVLRPPPALESRNPLAVALRAFRLILLNTLPESSRPDVLLLPRIDPELPEATFPRDPTPLLRAGLAAALETLPPVERGRPAPRPPRAAPDSLGRLVILADAPALAALGAAAFTAAAPARYDAGRVLDALDRLYATGLFTGVWPSIVPATDTVADREDGARPAALMALAAPALRVRLDARPPALLAGAAGYDTDRGGRAWAAVRARLPTGLPGELGLAASGHALERWVAVSARLIPPALAPLSWIAGGHYREADVRLFLDDRVAGEREVRRAGGWLGAEWRRVAPDAVLAAMLRAEHVDVAGGPEGGAYGPVLRLAEAGPLTRVVGLPWLIELEARFGGIDYRRARVGGAVETEAGRLLLAAVGDLTLAGGDAPPDVLPALGDERLMPGLRWGEARGRTRVIVGGDVAYPIPFEGMARIRGRAGAAADEFGGLQEQDRWMAGAELGALWTTPLGPILLSVGANTRGEWRLHAAVGPEF